MQTTTELGAAWWIFELCNRQSGGARQTPVKCQFNMSDWPGKRGEGKITIYEVACSRAADLAPLFLIVRERAREMLRSCVLGF
jgi:hypothetical protein